MPFHSVTANTKITDISPIPKSGVIKIVTKSRYSKYQIKQGNSDKKTKKTHKTASKEEMVMR